MRSARAGAAPIDKADAKANTLNERAKTDICCPVAALRDARASQRLLKLICQSSPQAAPCPAPERRSGAPIPAFAVG